MAKHMVDISDSESDENAGYETSEDVDLVNHTDQTESSKYKLETKSSDLIGRNGSVLISSLQLKTENEKLKLENLKLIKEIEDWK
jgi:hypothetical protein